MKIKIDNFTHQAQHGFPSFIPGYAFAHKLAVDLREIDAC